MVRWCRCTGSGRGRRARSWFRDGVGRELVEAVRAEIGVVPFREGEVGAAAEGGLVCGCGVKELAEEIAFGAVVEGGSVAGWAGVEEGEAVVVFGGDDEILSACVCE